MSEAQFQRQVIALAKLMRWLVYHVHDSRRSTHGYPDLCLCRERVVWAELKSDTGTLTPAQEIWLAALRAAGQEVYCWRPAQWGEIEEVLR